MSLHNSAYFRNDNWPETIFFFFIFLHSNVPYNLENRSQKSLLAPLQLMFPSKFDQNTPISHSDRVKTILSHMLTLKIGPRSPKCSQGFCYPSLTIHQVCSESIL